MNTKEIKLLKDWGKYKAGTVLELDERRADELIEAKSALLHDQAAEDAAAAEKEADEERLVALVKKAVKEEVKDDKKNPAGAVTSTHERSGDDPKGGFDTFGGFAIAVKDYHPGNDKRLDAIAEKAAGSGGLVEGIDADGGFTVPEEFRNELLTKTHETAAVVSRCRQISMSTPAVRIPTINETSRADGSRAGGVRAYRRAELGSHTQSKPTFGQVRLELENLYVFVYASQDLLADSAAMGSLIGTLASSELAFKMDDEVLNGTGSAQPLGILNAPCLVTVAKETGQAADTIVSENIMKMWARAYGPGRGNSVWLISQDLEPQLDQLYIAVGTGGIPIYMPANGLSGSPYGTLKGRPVIPCESCDNLGDVGDIILSDFNQYLYGSHVSGMRADTSMHLKFDFDQMSFRFAMRTDGQPWWSSALTPKNAGDTLSPFVTLAERA